jgi:hypothetical protein
MCIGNCFATIGKSVQEIPLSSTCEIYFVLGVSADLKLRTEAGYCGHIYGLYDNNH